MPTTPGLSSIRCACLCFAAIALSSPGGEPPGGPWPIEDDTKAAATTAASQSTTWALLNKPCLSFEILPLGAHTLVPTGTKYQGDALTPLEEASGIAPRPGLEFDATLAA